MFYGPAKRFASGPAIAAAAARTRPSRMLFGSALARIRPFISVEFPIEEKKRKKRMSRALLPYLFYHEFLL